MSQLPLPSPEQPRLSEGWIPNTLAWGVVGGIGAALFYSVANGLLRHSAATIEPSLVSAIKAIGTCLFFLPIYVIAIWKRQRLLPPGWDLFWLAVGAIQVQVIGSIGLQVAFAALGVALVVPLYLGTMVASSALMGRFFLHEPLRPISLVALSVLMLSALLLCGGAEQAFKSVGQTSPQAQVLGVSTWWGVLAGAATGVSYAILGIVIRRAMRHPIHALTPVMLVSISGSILLAPLAVYRLGWESLWQTPSSQWGVMWLAAVCNAVGFWSLIVALKRLPVLYVNAINVSQAAFAALAGVCFFGEFATPWLWSGLILMSIGFAVLGLGTTRWFNHRPPMIAAGQPNSHPTNSD